MDNAVPRAVTVEVIEKHRAEWCKELESFRVAMEVANVLGDPDERRTQIRTGAERCVKAIEKLNSMLAELGNVGVSQ